MGTVLSRFSTRILRPFCIPLFWAIRMPHPRWGGPLRRPLASPWIRTEISRSEERRVGLECRRVLFRSHESCDPFVFHSSGRSECRTRGGGDHFGGLWRHRGSERKFLDRKSVV